MGRKTNPEWRIKNASRKARQKPCDYCDRPNALRLLIQVGDQLMHPACAILYQSNLDKQKVKREWEKQEHLAIRDFWLDNKPKQAK